MKKILLIIMIFISVGCNKPPKITYFNEISYYMPNGEKFRKYTFTSEYKPFLRSRWDGRQYVYIQNLPIKDLPPAPQAWFIEIETRKELTSR